MVPAKGCHLRSLEEAILGGKSQASTRPTALGSMLQSSTYGATIPMVIGTTRSPFLPIWAADLRIGASGKKGKGKGKKGPPTYVENIDMLIGSNPILNVLQIWFNAVRYPLNFLTQDFPPVAGLVPTVFTISDPNFYALVGVTIFELGDLPGTFNDYGAQGPVNYNRAGQEWPMWNAFQVGPDPINESGYRFTPYTYRWNPSFGPTFQVDADLGGNVVLLGTVRAYYAQLSAVIKHKTPLAQARLTFENQLGNGPEFANSSRPGQQIIYPQYAGCGSPNIDLGSSGAIPSLRPEVQGSYTMYPRGDVDFTDMIESVVRSGVLHTGYELAEIQRGVNCCEFPGPIQKKYQYQPDGGVRFLPPDYIVTEGNYMLVFARRRDDGTPQAISDTAGNSWISLYSGATNGAQIDVWYAIHNGGTLTSIHVTPSGFDMGFEFYEMGGVDTLDSFQMFTGTTKSPIGSIATSNEAGTPAFAMAFFDCYIQSGSAPQRIWRDLIPKSVMGTLTGSFYRTVYFPGALTFQMPNAFGTAQPWALFMIAFKNSQPVPYVKALGNILDEDALTLTRNQCRTGGLFGSVSMDSQRKASDWLADFATCANAVYVWSGDKLKVIPRSEVSATDRGAIYISPTAAGPVADLSEKDFIADSSTPPVTVKRTAQVDLPNILQIEHLDRNSDYNQCVTSQPDAASVALYGPRKASPQTLHMIQDPVIARKILSIQTRRNAYIRNTYSFKLKTQWVLLEPMDLVTLTEPLLGLNKLPVRLTKVAENDKFELDCEAEPFLYGVHAPNVLTATAPQPNSTFQNIIADPGSVNVPLIFEPLPRLYGSLPTAQLWAVVSSPNPAYGGCLVYVSTDGGGSYNQIQDPKAAGIIIGNATTGKVVTDWPAAADPDTTNDLLLDLTESNGSLQSISLIDENNFIDPCYVEGAGSPSPTVNGAAQTSGFNDPPPPLECAFTSVPNAAIINAGGPNTGQSQQIFVVGHFRSGYYFANGPSGGMVQAPCLWTPSPPGRCVRINIGRWTTQCCNSLTIFNQGSALGTVYDLEMAAISVANGGPATFGLFFGNTTDCFGIIHGEEFAGTVVVPIFGSWSLCMIYVPPHTPGNPGIVIALLDGAITMTPAGWAHPAPTDAGYCGVFWKYATQPDPAGDNYELMTYAVANLTAQSKYTLKATGVGNELRRAVYGLPCSIVVGQGIDHPVGSRFALLSPAGTGISKMNMDPLWIGRQLFFKFPAFNSLMAQQQSLADAVAYPYTPTGCASQIQSPNYTVTGGALRQSCSDPTIVTMDQATVTFPTNSVNYNARTFTIPTILITTTFYVTIYDPQYLGDTGTQTNLSAFIETSTAKVGVAGYVYIGAITALPAGCGGQTGSGGLPNLIDGLAAQPTKTIPLAPGVAGNFTVAHGLGVTPAYVLITDNSGSAIWLQSPTSFDSTNIYFTSADPLATGIASIFVTPADAEIALAPGAPGNFTVAHGLGTTPLMALVEMLSDGAIRWQATPWDGTNLYLVASDASVTGKVEVLKSHKHVKAITFARLPLMANAGGNFTIPHGMGAVPTSVVIRMDSDAAIWLQSPLGFDGTNLYLVASEDGITGEAEIWA